MMSTMLRENLALGGKSLSCNFTKSHIWDFPIKGICFFNNLNFEAFEKRLIKLLSMSYKDYLLGLNNKPDYLIFSHKNHSTQEMLKKRIKDLLKK